ncbi:MAG: glycosyltransferase [Spirochaetaceae bacterium]|nr:glycosyltransferase [Spirochaetaceae bacterium]
MSNQAFTVVKRFKDDLRISPLRTCFLIPWYIFKIFCITYNKFLPRRNIKLLLRAYFFSPYYVVKLFLKLIQQQASKKKHNKKSAGYIANKILTEGNLKSFDGTVSVVIPVYNGGDDLKNLIAMLKKQEKVGKIEIIAIDSGSVDGSVEFLKKEDVNLTEIPNKDFSHSGTRNLGAKKATGAILLFMTQDALPMDKEWVFKMILPILEYGVVATTGIEKVKEKSTLFACLANNGFRQYFGANNGDRIAYLPCNKKDSYSLRRNALLNNIGCAVRKDVFTTFFYQGEYGEDLDLGVRLIQAGHKIALLSSIQTIHSHDRSCSYYLRYVYIDTKTNKNIFPDLYHSNKSLKEIIASAFCAYYHLQKLFTYIHSLQGDLSISEFFNSVMYFWNNSLKETFCEQEALAFGSWYSDSTVDDFFQMVLISFPKINLDGFSYIESQKHYFDVRLRNYIAVNFKSINADLRRQVIDTMYKDLMWKFAFDLALYFCDNQDKDNPLFITLEKMSKGV